MSSVPVDQALRLQPDALGQWPCVAVVGAGGKTTLFFQLAQALVRRAGVVLMATTTHLGLDQAGIADQHTIVRSMADLTAGLERLGTGTTGLFTGPVVDNGERLGGLEETQVSQLWAAAQQRKAPLLVEADGSRRKPLKAPADHEPAIPRCADLVVVCAGLSGLGKPLSADWVHRPERFAMLSGLGLGEQITPQDLGVVLTHPLGGMKNIRTGVRRVLLLNQADTQALEAQARQIRENVLKEFPSVVAAALGLSGVRQVWEPVAGIVLAAGEARRFGKPKQLLEWEGEPLVRRAARMALIAGLDPVVVVCGAHGNEVAHVLRGLDVQIAHNPDWNLGQSSSLKTGLRCLPVSCGGAVFLLADQPFASVDVIQALVQAHASRLAPIVAPRVGDRRANPIFFDRDTFSDLMTLEGDTGGRVLIQSGHYRIEWLPWLDEWLLLDIDTPEDYTHLVGGEP